MALSDRVKGKPGRLAHQLATAVEKATCDFNRHTTPGIRPIRGNTKARIAVDSYSMLPNVARLRIARSL